MVVSGVTFDIEGSLVRGTVLCPWARHFIFFVQPLPRSVTDHYCRMFKFWKWLKRARITSRVSSSSRGILFSILIRCGRIAIPRSCTSVELWWAISDCCLSPTPAFILPLRSNFVDERKMNARWTYDKRTHIARHSRDSLAILASRENILWFRATALRQSCMRARLIYGLYTWWQNPMQKYKKCV